MSPKQPSISKEKALTLLGVSPAAGPMEIHRAYRRLAFESHPDRHGGQIEMEVKFKEISEAYKILVASFSGEEGADFSEIPERGRDIQHDIQVDFLDAAAGGEMNVEITRPYSCLECEEMENGENKPVCASCGGIGEVFKKVNVEFLIPSGIEAGETVQVPGEGASGRAGGRSGDLFLKVFPARHPALERRGLNVHSEVRVPAFRLINGGTVRVFTVQGGAHVEISPKTTPGRTFRLKGWGIRRIEGGRSITGDHLVRILKMPDKPPPPPKRR
ncbi:MAG: J domain-containing protein [Nitrospinaceae bacterium]|nr:J domain-containing protein [Nitrospinaceae bacterium]MBT3433714.1 J domain-containing protein [Nitrospinaceae bacterium]MBT3823167.1 J domain-containing protein [Nitrospinaceae bacterium]MBT4093432.1 J domain-containing protein [Nitrospinaceae bacterium]MBT4429253.1 J domain-containing protein [Nitrospinaceae bacterium]